MHVQSEQKNPLCAAWTREVLRSLESHSSLKDGLDIFKHVLSLCTISIVHVHWTTPCELVHC